MQFKTIIGIVIVLLLIYAIIILILNRNVQTNLLPGIQSQIIPAKSLENSSIPHSPNRTYSIWAFIDNWNYRIGEQKYILVSGKIMSDGSIIEQSPAISLDKYENNLIVETTYNNSNSNSNSNNNLGVHKCSVTNIPIQKWVNILVSISGRTMDIYIDGKLVNTCLLPGVATVTNNPIYITPDGGFSGYTSKFAYYAYASTSEDAWNIYKEGAAQGWLASLLNTRVQITFSENGIVENSITV